MAITRSRALTGRPEPRPKGPQIKDPIEYTCPTCCQTYQLDRGYRLHVPGTFVLGQGHLLVTCPEGHRATIETTLQHIA